MAPLSSRGFNPFSIWQCPNCQHSYHAEAAEEEDSGDRVVDSNSNDHGAPSKNVLFYRGTCCHDVCINCIATVMSLVKKKVKSEEAVLPDHQPILTTVTCPIIVNRNRLNRTAGRVRTCQGQFHVDAANIPPPVVNKDNMVIIDLCDDEEIEESVSTASSTAVTIKVKRENGEEQLPLPQPSLGQVVVPVKNEALQPEPVLSTSGAVSSFSSPSASTIAQASLKPNTAYTLSKVPIPVTNISYLKPLFEEGDEVYAPWWKLKGPAWFLGKVISHKTIDATSQYGPTRLYRILFYDGDYLDKIEDYNVFSKSDYELIESFRKRRKGKKYIGVRNQVDKMSTDKWAKIVGWYEITGKDGTVQSFSTLTDAMRAHDARVVRDRGSQTERSSLNIPEDYPELFALTKTEAPEVMATTRPTTSQVQTNVVSPESLPPVRKKRDSDVLDDDTIVHGNRKVKHERLQLEVKCRRLGPSLEEKFTGQAFMKEPLFHLNSFLCKMKINESVTKVNEGFSEFIREGIATPGFLPLPKKFTMEKIANWSKDELRVALNMENYDTTHATSQVALWLKHATVGSFIIMRHEYPDCPFCPKRLINADGKYIGSVYVIGMITKKVVPGSEEETDIKENKMGEFSRGRWPIHTVCRVAWRWMGKMESLQKSTTDYISQVVQPTLARICNTPGKEYFGGTTESIRQDLWRNATEIDRGGTEISSDEFPDVFNHDIDRIR